MLAAAFPKPELVKYEAMDALYARQLELEDKAKQFEPISDQLVEARRLAINLLKSQRGALVESSRSNGHLIAGDLLALEAENAEAVWLTCCKSLFVALFHLAGLQAVLEGSTNVLELVALPPAQDKSNRDTEFYKVTKHIADKGWERPDEYTSAENWKAVTEIACEIASDRH